MSLYDNFELVNSGPHLGPRGYAFRLSRPIAASFLNSVAVAFNRTIESSSQSLHLIAIANSGVPLATAILMYRLAKLNHPQDWLSIADPGRLEQISDIFPRPAQSLMIDNSINSGRTLLNILYKLRANNLQVSTLVKLVDYEDALEKEESQSLRDEFGVMTLSLFTKTVIIESCDSKRQANSIGPTGLRGTQVRF